MKYLFLFLFLLLPLQTRAGLILNYGLNYSTESEDSDVEYEKSKTFHKFLIGGSVNSNRTLFLGWNINYWSTALTYNGGDEDNYSLQEMGPKLVWFFNDNYNWYTALEWNPYVVGTRTKSGTESDVEGSSTAFSFGYRFKIANNLGLGAGVTYHSASFDEEKVNSSATDISDSITNIMPMLEFTFITK